MEPSDGHPRFSLPCMPTEILSLIVKLVDIKTLQALRLTNKRLWGVSSDHFALQYFSTREHVATAYSLDALIQITAHPFFRKFVKAVIISGYLPEPPCECVQSEHHVLSLAKTREKLDTVFTQIKREPSSISIGVSGLYYQDFFYGSKHFAVSKGRLCDHRGKFGPSIALAKVFGLVFDAAQRSGCTIEGVKVDIPSDQSDVMRNTRDALPEFAKLVQTNIIPLDKPLSLDLMIDPEWNFGHLMYNHRTGTLKLSRFYLSSSYHAVLSYQNLFPAVRKALPWLMSFSICHVQVSDCIFHGEDMLEMLYAPTLQSLTLQETTLDTKHFDTSLWSHVLKRLSHTTQLRHLEIFKACYRVNTQNIDRSFKRYLKLPSGLYELKAREGVGPWWFEFCLNLPGALDETLVLADSTSISVELKALADQVAQMEIDKTAEIESDGFVRNNIVGIPKENQTDDVISNEDDNDNTEDDESDEIGGDYPSDEVGIEI